MDGASAVRAVLEKGPEYHGFAVWAADSGWQAFQLYWAHRPEIDVVPRDISMPSLKGPNSLFALQQLNPAVRLCFMSGDVGPYTEEDLLRQGARSVF